MEKTETPLTDAFHRTQMPAIPKYWALLEHARQLERELRDAQACIRDAERYRWLRDGLAGMEVADHAIEVQEFLLDADEMTVEQFDTALDSAIESARQK